MRSITTIFFLSLFLTFSLSTAAPGSNNNNKACTQCWVSARIKLAECQNISAAEAGAFKDVTDTQLTKDPKFRSVVSCLCQLSEKTESILSTCAKDCTGEFAQGLSAESGVVAKQLCGVGKFVANSTPNTSPENGSTPQSPTTTSNETEPTAQAAYYGSGASLITPGSGPPLSLAIALVAAVIFTL